MIFAYGALIFAALCFVLDLGILILGELHSDHALAKAVKKAQAKRKKKEDSL